MHNAASYGGATAVRGRVGPKILGKSAELFRQDLKTALQELFQNARRAGASAIAVERGGGPGGRTLTLRDDGRGVADFQDLLTFGGSGWAETLDAAENAAGMGFFSVASRGAVVRSRGRRVGLTPEVFRGEAAARVLDDPDGPRAGTEVAFPVEEDARAIAREVAGAARYFPLAVTLDGEPVERRDFLAEAAAVADWGAPRPGTRGGGAWNRVRVGVMRRADDGWSPLGVGHGRVNFHGVVAGFKDAGHRVEVCEEDGTAWSVRFDVAEAPDLRLMLPTREWVIADAFALALLAHARALVYRHVASRPSHALPFREAQKARDMGVAMPDAAIRLKRWAGRRASEWQDTASAGDVPLAGDDAHPVAVDEDLAASDVAAANLTLLADAAGEGAPVLVRGKRAWEGYPAYDRLARVERLDAVVALPDGTAAAVRADERWDADEADDADAALRAVAAACGGEDPRTVVAPGVAVSATIRDPSADPRAPGATRAWTADTKLAFTAGADWGEVETTGLIAAADAGVGAVAEALVEHFHHPSDDADAGSHDQQEEWAREGAYKRAREALLPPSEAKLRTLLDAANLERWRLLDADLAGLTVTRRVAEDGTVGFRIAAIAVDGTRVTAGP